MNARIRDTIAAVEAFIPTVDDALALSREAASFTRALVLATGAKRGVEIGTSYGYSGLWIGSALFENGGSLVTMDCEARKLDIARANFEAAGLSDCIEVREGSAADSLATIPGPIDFVLNDADKENCRRYVELLADKLADRAIVLTDNTTSHASILGEFVDWIRARDDFTSTHVAIGSGMELSVRRTEVSA